MLCSLRQSNPTFAAAVFMLFCLSIGTNSYAQTPVDNTTSTPVPGDQHYYISDLNDVVSPVNGALSVRVLAPTPHVRGINLPKYAFIYDTNGTYYPQGADWYYNSTYGAQLLGGIEWGTPSWLGPTNVAWNGPANSVNSNTTTLSAPEGSGPDMYCTYWNNFTYTDATGGRHPISNFIAVSNPQIIGGCGGFNIYATPTGQTGGDGHYTALFKGAASNVQVFDLHGNQLVLAGGVQPEDPNGNYLGGPGYTATTTALTIPGLGGPYGWSGTSTSSPNGRTVNYNATAASSPQGYDCPTSFPTTEGLSYGNQTLTLPNNQEYTFSFDPLYNFIDQISYPTGVVVAYTWSMNSQSEWVNLAVPGGVNCSYRYDWPAITKRVVSIAGTETEEQDFAYTTTPSTGQWTQKTTTVTTIDKLRSGTPTTKVVYTYSANPGGMASPLESSIQYYGTDGALLKTVSRVWNADLTLEAECTTDNTGKTSGVFYKYQGSTPELITDKAEYGFGLNTSYCQQPAIGTSPTWPTATPTRETKTQYATFASNTVNPNANLILDHPQSVQVYGNGTLISEVDYVYDETAPVSVTANNHDSNYGTSYQTGRGNATSITHKCIAGTGCTQDSVTHYTYDVTGQVVSMIDADNHPATTYSYTDNYVSGYGSPSGNSNAFLTSITYPTVNGIAQTESFSYGYYDGHLRSQKDVNNGTTTTYCYTTGGCGQSTIDPWARLTEIDYPDLGGKNIQYNDTGDNPSWSETTKLNSSGTTMITTSILDGMGRVIHTQLNSDPYTTTTSDTIYDGVGQVWTQSNAHRSGTNPTDGTTTWVYDGLGRKIKQSNQDGTIKWWCYNGIASASQPNCSAQIGSNTGSWADSRDESGNNWQHVSDGLERLVSAIEPSGSAATASMETDYTYDALNNLLSVTQWGGASGSPGARTRSFTYDSLSRLITASNPESGTVCYGVWSSGKCINGYDANGNLSAKTDARGITTSYNYDALNRLTSKSYSDGSGPVLYGYDLSSVGFTNGSTTQHETLTNYIGRMSYGCQENAAQNFCTTLTAFSYDPMGRISHEWSSTPSFTTTGTVYSSSAVYDLAGDMTSITYPDGRTVGQTFDTAGRESGVNYTSWNGTAVGTPYFAEGPLTVGGVSYAGYDPVGHLTSGTLGNGVTMVAAYNPRLELTSLGYAQASTLWGKSYGWTPNANLQTMADSVSGVIRQFGYDTLNRLASAQDIAGTSGSSGQTTDTSDQSQSNDLENSTAFGGTGWGGANWTMALNSVAAPDGSMTAATLGATSGSTNTYATDFVLNSSLYDGQAVNGSVWLRVPSGTQTVNLGIVTTGDSGSITVGNTPELLTTSWQQFQVSGTLQNGLSQVALQIGGSNTIVAGQTVDIWGPQLQTGSTTGTVTNYVPYSQQVGGALWSPYCSANTSNMTLNTTALTAPDGTHTATSYTTPNPNVCGGSGALGAYATLAAGLTAGQTYTVSAWLRGANGGESVYLGLNDCISTLFTLTTAWKRYTATYTSIPSGSSGANCTTGVRGFEVLDNINASATFYVWGAQTEISSSAGQYVATLDVPITVDANSTNILPASEQVGVQSWVLLNSTIAANSTTVAAPDGSFTADAVTSTAATATFSDTVSNPALYDGATVTASVYLCVPSGTTLNGLLMYINNSNGTLATISQKINLTGTWQRFQLTGTLQNGLSNLVFGLGSGSTFPSGQTIYVWGAQIVTGTSPGPPIETTPTTTSDTNGSTVGLAANGLNESYSYDTFGNMLQAGNFNFVQAYTTANQLSGWSYDASGNLLNNGLGESFTYDAEGRISAVSGGISYAYDAEGNRVAKTGGAATDYVYFGGKQLARFAGGQWTDMIYGPGGLLAEVPGTQTGAPVYRMADHLGTAVGTLSSTGTVLSLTDYAPFGQIFAGGSTDPYKFTGKERDTESGNDYFGARYYASSMGRFMSPDPSGLTYADPINPQSFNLYSYALNNPLKNTDPTGMYCDYGDPDNDADMQDGSANRFDYHSSQSECETADENGNKGTWINDAETHQDENGDWVDNDGRQEGYSMATIVDSDPQGLPVTQDEFGGTQFHLDPYYNYISTDFLNKPTSTIGPTPPPRKLTPSQIMYWCAVAASLSGGGTVPGGIDPSLPGVDTEEQGMMVPSRKATFPNQSPKMEYQQLNEGARPVEAGVNLVGVIGSAGGCVGAVTAAQNAH